jgi:protocatechuate 3,4-dioxygenase beta subunit
MEFAESRFALIPAPITLSEITGPLPALAASTCTDADLLLNMRASVAPAGDPIVVEGYVRDRSGQPVGDALIEVWQCNAAGRYHDGNDSSNGAPLDPGFLGFGRCLTGVDGYYRFRTIRPGRRRPGRALHIHFSVLGDSWLSRLFTHLYFEDDPEVWSDPTIGQLPPQHRDGIVARLSGRSDGLCVYRFDITLRRVPFAQGQQADTKSAQARTVSRPTPPMTLGRFFRAALLREGLEVNWNRLFTDETRGQRVRIEGLVRDGSERPVRDVLVEIWQANGYGRYHHPADGREVPWDPAFIGYGRCVTDGEGRFVFETIKPGQISVDGVAQSPHINVLLALPDARQIYYTRLYFEEDLLLEQPDPVLDAVGVDKRWSLIARKTDVRGGLAGYRWDLRLGGGEEGGGVFFDFFGSGQRVES